MDIKHQVKKITNSRGSTVFILVVGEVVVGLLIFHAGVAYGERHAFGRMHGPGTPPPGFGFFSHSFIPEDHGAVGRVTNVATSTLTLQTRDGETEIIAIDDDTVVQGPTPDATAADLALGQNIVVIGEPGESAANRIVAKLIRILPQLNQGVVIKTAPQQ